MIDLIVIIGIVLIATAPLLLFRKTDNTRWLKLKQVAEERLTRYEGTLNDLRLYFVLGFNFPNGLPTFMKKTRKEAPH